jgi:hypothetical protein
MRLRQQRREIACEIVLFRKLRTKRVGLLPALAPVGTAASQVEPSLFPPIIPYKSSDKAAIICAASLISICKPWACAF